MNNYLLEFLLTHGRKIAVGVIPGSTAEYSIQVFDMCHDLYNSGVPVEEIESRMKQLEASNFQWDLSKYYISKSTRLVTKTPVDFVNPKSYRIKLPPHNRLTVEGLLFCSYLLHLLSLH